MKIFRNRTVIGVLCILLALIICFGVTPLFSRSASEKTEIVRVTMDIKEGDEITAEMVQTVEVGAYNLPQNLMTDKKEVVGKYATADLAAGDYILSSKLSAVPAAENAYLYNLDGTKQAISVTIKSFATGLSGKLESGDIVTVIVADYQGKGETAIPPELQYVEVISVTASSGYDANTGEVVDEKELPSTVTLLVTTEQAKVLAELEQDSELHLALVYRGTPENAAKFIAAQDTLIEELYAEPEPENSGETAGGTESKESEGGGSFRRKWGRRMNFLKGSLFRRNTEPEELEPMEESRGGILAVWGSPGCGKTVTAVKIAKHLAAQKKNTVLLLCDMTAPMMPCICPPSELEVDKSLGSIFAAQHISVNLIKHNLTTLKRLPHLTMLGLRKKENEYTYAPCTKQQAEELIRGLREIVPYVVIDCSSYIANDILSAVALMEADSVLQLASCDLKSVGYLSSQLPLLGELKWDKDKQYRVASNIKPFQAADRIGQVLGSVVFRLPYSQELEEQYLAGELLADLSMKDSRAFRKEIDRICEEVF